MSPSLPTTAPSAGARLLTASQEFPAYKRSLITQGRAFCAITAPQCREKIAALAVDFLVDDCTVLTHSYSRTVIQTILRAHKQHKRIKVYVTEARPSCTGSVALLFPPPSLESPFADSQVEDTCGIDGRGDTVYGRVGQCRGVHHGPGRYGSRRVRGRRRVGREWSQSTLGQTKRMLTKN